MESATTTTVLKRKVPDHGKG